jgi:hypothetical protein
MKSFHKKYLFSHFVVIGFVDSVFINDQNSKTNKFDTCFRCYQQSLYYKE